MIEVVGAELVFEKEEGRAWEVQMFEVREGREGGEEVGVGLELDGLRVEEELRERRGR